MTDTSRRALWGVTAFYLAVTVVLAAPFSLHPGTRLLTNDSDAMLVRWILAWDVHAFTAQPWAIFDANTFAPLPNTLAYAENLIGGALFAITWMVHGAGGLGAVGHTALADFAFEHKLFPLAATAVDLAIRSAARE